MKQWNPARKLAHIATVSRNAIILRFSRWREQQCLALERAAEATRRAKKTTWTALAWKAASETERPVGQRFTSCMEAASPAAAPAPSGNKASRVDPGAKTAMQRRVLQDIRTSQDAYNAILATCYLPATRQQWVE